MVSTASRNFFSCSLQLVNTQLINGPEQREESEHVKPAEPNRLVPGGRDVEVQMRSLFIPDSVVIAGYDSKMVLAGTKPGIKSFATSARVLPVFIHSFQPVPKPYLLRHGQAQCRVANLQIGCSRGQGQIRQRTSLSAIRAHRPNQNRRRKCICGDVGRIDPNDSV